MGSPGGREVGRVSIRVVPDTSGFRRDLQRELDAVEKSLKVTIPVEFDIDTAALRAELEGIRAQVTIPVDFDVDTARLREQLGALDNARISIPVDLDLDTGALRARLDALSAEQLTITVNVDLDTAALQARLAALDSRQVNIRIDLQGVALALAELTELELVLNRIDGSNVHVDIEVDTAGALAQIAALEAALAGLRGTLGSFGGGGGIGGIGGLAGTLGQLLQISVILAALPVIGAAITEAYGLAATAIAAIPAALSLVAVPMGAVMLGLDGIKKAAQTLKPEFDKLKQSVSDVFEKGFTQAFNTVRGLFTSVLTPGFTYVAQSINQVVQAIAGMLATADGITLLTNIFNGVGNTIRNIIPGIKDIVDSLLILAGRASVFQALEAAVNNFGAAFRRDLIDNINDGSLDAAVQGLQGTLTALGTALADLVHNGIELFASAAPGLNAAISSLTGFFNKFDWNALGASVSNVFSGLATAINNVPQGTIDAIAGSFQRLGQTFQDAAFQQKITDMVSAIPAAIDTINQFTQTFAGIGAAIADGLKAFDTIDTKFQQVVTSVNNAATQIGQALGVGAGSPLSTTLNDFNDWINHTLGIIPPEVHSAGSSAAQAAQDTFGKQLPDAVKSGADQMGQAAGQGAAAVPPAVSSGLAPTPGAAASALAGLSPAVTDPLKALGPIASAAMADVVTAIGTGLTSINLQVAPALAGLSLEFMGRFLEMQASVQTGMAGVTEAVTTGMSNADAALTAGLGNLGRNVGATFTGVLETVRGSMLAISTAMTTGWAGITVGAVTTFSTLQTTITTAMTGIVTTVQNGMLAISTALTTGWAGITLGAITTFLTLQTTVTTAMTGIVTAVQTGMTSISNAMTIGLAGVTLGWITQFLTIQTTVQNAMVGMTTAVQTGMTAITTSFTTGLTGVSTAFTTAFTGVSTTVTTAMTGIVTAVQNGMNTIVSTIAAGMAVAITGWTVSWLQMQTTAQNAIQGVVTAIQNGMNNAVNAVNNAVTSMVNALNGAVDKFRAAGENMGQALADGLNNKAGAVEAAAARLANAAAAAVAAAAQINSPSRVFLRLGAFMGAGLDAGIDHSTDDIIATARRLVDELTAEFERFNEISLQDPSAKWAVDLTANVRSALAQVDTTAAGAGSSGRQTVIETNIYNPAPESGSDSVTKANRRLAALGLFG